MASLGQPSETNAPESAALKFVARNKAQKVKPKDELSPWNDGEISALWISEKCGSCGRFRWLIESFSKVDALSKSECVEGPNGPAVSRVFSGDAGCVVPKNKPMRGAGPRGRETESERQRSKAASNTLKAHCDAKASGLH